MLIRSNHNLPQISLRFTPLQKKISNIFFRRPNYDQNFKISPSALIASTQHLACASFLASLIPFPHPFHKRLEALVVGLPPQTIWLLQGNLSGYLSTILKRFTLCVRCDCGCNRDGEAKRIRGSLNVCNEMQLVAVEHRIPLLSKENQKKYLKLGKFFRFQSLHLFVLAWPETSARKDERTLGLACPF